MGVCGFPALPSGLWRKFGREFCYLREGEQRRVTAYLAPIRERERIPLPTLAGWAGRQQFLVLYPAGKEAPRAGEVLERAGESYLLQLAEPVWAGGRKGYCWAVAVRTAPENAPEGWNGWDGSWCEG